jgi:major membrane immunogen (membrane-anchored lipoprotein)
MRIILASALVLLVACNNSGKKEAIKVAGVYKMLSQNFKNDKMDTNYNSILQLKIFTDDQIMYANVNPADSASSFGVGYYTASGDTVTENVIYTSSGDSKNDTMRTFKLAIEKTDKGYKQIIPDIGGPNDSLHTKLTEEYENAGTETKTPLDGVWKLTRALTIKGKDTTVQKITQYKVYYSGHVIFGHSYADSLNKNHTGIAFGKFEMSGNNKVKEKMAASTYYQVRGQSFDLDIVTNGDDEFTQTITEKDGSKGVETYQRLKK